jgi:GntR family transcriptional regulator, transcriptional repressor for pyruvate dehydrogenase complex
MFEKIPVQTMSDNVAERLLAQIDNGTFAKGHKLPTEAALAEAFGVSRTVIREAVSRLRNEGVVESRQGSGMYVRSGDVARPLRIDFAEASDPDGVPYIIELRRAIESEVAAVAAERRTQKQMTAIDKALAAIDKAVEAGSDGVREDLEFHRAIANATGNPFFLKTLTFLHQYLEAGMKVTRHNEATHENFAQQVKEEHNAIVAAVRAKDIEGARRAAQTHMINAARRLREARG